MAMAYKVTLKGEMLQYAIPGDYTLEDAVRAVRKRLPGSGFDYATITPLGEKSSHYGFILIGDEVWEIVNNGPQEGHLISTDWVDHVERA